MAVVFLKRPLLFLVGVFKVVPLWQGKAAPPDRSPRNP